MNRSVADASGSHPLIPLDVRRWLPRRLLAWFHKHRRELPWRSNRDPYAIWVSEVMLQQTQVTTVVPYFERFLERFPTIADLAAAQEQDVLRLWEGLGYYRRARDLHRAARVLANEEAGVVPNDVEAFRRLPGVGRYTLGAVLSQAFDRRLPILEANSLRVLCRLFGQTGDPRAPAVQRWLWQAAEAILPAKNAGDFNQALMELGALLCTPADPECGRCPLTGRCHAQRHNLQQQIPRKAAAPQIVAIEEVAVVVRKREKVLLVQRPEKGRWASMWEFPHAERLQGENADKAARRIAAEMTGLDVEPGAELLTVRHGVTRFRITLFCLEARCCAGRFVSPFYRRALWLRPKELHTYPVSVPQRRLAKTLLLPRPVQLF